MYGIKDIRFAVRMAPIPEQIEQIKHYIEAAKAAKGFPPTTGMVLSGY